MPVSLAFDAAHQYTETLDGIEVPITLCLGRQSVELLAKPDTGAAHCIFDRKYAEMLGVDVTPAGFNVSGPWLGRLQRFNTRSQFRRLVSSFQRSSSLPRTPHSTGTSLAARVGLTAFASPLSITTACSS